jgi:hypothetical protein
MGDLLHILNNLWNDHDFLSTLLTILALIIVTWVVVRIKSGKGTSWLVERFEDEKAEKTDKTDKAEKTEGTGDGEAEKTPEAEGSPSAPGLLGLEIKTMNDHLSNINQTLSQLVVTVGNIPKQLAQ